uniref:Uncharacterized protein n=1 Tax=Anguilla anguilla TaxID=7936 RepID=A0A0E9XVJ9_ANGAN
MKVNWQSRLLQAYYIALELLEQDKVDNCLKCTYIHLNENHQSQFHQ